MKTRSQIIMLAAAAASVAMHATTSCAQESRSPAAPGIQTTPPPRVLPILPTPKPDRIERVSPPYVTVSPEPAAPPTIVEPRWRVPPAIQFPERALALDIAEGRVVLECLTDPTGAVRRCQILEETPLDAGFAQAARSAAYKALVHPQTVDGKATWSRIRFPTRFQSSDPPPADTARPY